MTVALILLLVLLLVILIIGLCVAVAEGKADPFGWAFVICLLIYLFFMWGVKHTRSPRLAVEVVPVEPTPSPDRNP